MSDKRIIAVTGHRPDKLGDYSTDSHRRLYRFALHHLPNYRPDEVLTGMALGWDTAIAEACVTLNIPYTACIPFIGQEGRWRGLDRQHYFDLLSRATQVVTVCRGSFAPWKMQKRNEWMVDRCTKVLALYNGSSGGTQNCVKYAEASGRQVVNLWDCWIYPDTEYSCYKH